MSFLEGVRAQFRPTPEHINSEDVSPAPPTGTDASKHDAEKNNQIVDSELNELPLKQLHNADAVGVAKVEAIQSLWGKKGKYFLIAGLGMIMMMFELDNTTFWVYQSYATSDFNALSNLATLGTAGSIVFAIVKPPIAKLADVMGRGETYIFTLCCYVISYILCAAAKDYNTYAAGYIIHNLAQSGTNILNDILISDISSARWRGFAIGISFFPFLFSPWIAAYIIQDVVTGIGWKWGIGMFCFLMPFAFTVVIGTLLFYQRKAHKMKIVVRQKMTIYDFCSQVDLGGLILLSGGFATLLLPFTLAATSTGKWKTPYIIALIVLGVFLLALLPVYEKFVAKHPVVPIHYFKNLTIVMSILLITTDTIGFAVTHTYLYTWAVIARDFSARDATFYNYTNGVMQCLSAIIAGLIMAKTRKYKWLTFGGIIIRLIGYGLMIRLRGADNSVAELFIVQIIQGIGSGIIQTTALVAAQISVSHSQMGQMTALVIMCLFLGSSIGSSIAGGIYSGTFKEQLANQLGPGASQSLIDMLFDSIVGVVPVWGTVERVAINLAYSNVVRFFTYAAFASCIPSLVLAWFLPDVTLPDHLNNIVDS